MIIRQQQTRCRHLLGRTSFTCLVMVLPWLVGLAVTWPAHSQAAQAATACVVNNANFEAASFRPWYLQVDASQGADAQLNVDSGYDSPKAARVDTLPSAGYRTGMCSLASGKCR